MQQYANTIQDNHGNGVIATINVYLTGTTTLANLFSNSLGTIGIANPIVTPASGAFAFYAANGTYDLVISGSGFTTKTISITLGTSFEVAGVLTADGLIDDSAAAAGQIKFPQPQHPSSDLNTLDDYDERSWAPLLRFGGASTGITYSYNVGTSVKIGSLVHAAFNILLTSKGSSTGAATIAGVPYTAETAVNSTWSGLMRWSSMAVSLVSMECAINASAVIINLYGDTAASAGNTALTDTAFGNTSNISGTIVFRATD